jgi:hypothetical protein
MANLKGDLSRLVVLHDVERWKDLKIVKEVEGFRTDEVASGAPLISPAPFGRPRG